MIDPALWNDKLVNKCAARSDSPHDDNHHTSIDKVHFLHVVLVGDHCGCNNYNTMTSASIVDDDIAAVGQTRMNYGIDVGIFCLFVHYMYRGRYNESNYPMQELWQ